MKRKSMMVAAMAAMIVAGCGGGDNSTEDAHDVKKCTTPEQRGCEVVAAPDVLGSPNGFPNVAYSCTKIGTAVYITTDRVVIVQPNPNCPGYVDGKMPNVVSEGR